MQLTTLRKNWFSYLVFFALVTLVAAFLLPAIAAVAVAILLTAGAAFLDDLLNRLTDHLRQRRKQAPAKE